MGVLLLLAGCQSEEDPAVQNPPGPVLPPVDTSFEVDIDDSDLVTLGVDEGGTHSAVPVDMTTGPYGYYVYQPSTYEEDGPEFPLLIFLHGWSPNLGSEPLDRVLLGGPPRLIEAGDWQPSYPMVVVSPQLTAAYWRPDLIHEFIEYLIETYQINVSRIYLTGLSLGGGGCWYYVGETDDHYATAIVPISASGAPHLIDNLSQVPSWAFHGAQDRTVEAYENFGSVPLVEAINNTNPLVPARVTVYPNSAHNAWTITYNGVGTRHEQWHDVFDVDLYDWMLSYKKE